MQRLAGGIPVTFEHQAHVAEQEFRDGGIERLIVDAANLGACADQRLKMFEIEQVGAHNPHRLDAVAVMHLADALRVARVVLANTPIEKGRQVQQLLLHQVCDASAGRLVVLQYLGGRRMVEQVVIEGLGEALASASQSVTVSVKEAQVGSRDVEEIVEGGVEIRAGVSPLCIASVGSGFGLFHLVPLCHSGRNVAPRPSVCAR